MSDHLIAEANRHAMALPTTQPTHADIAWYVREVSELRAILASIEEDGTEEHNAAVRLRQELAAEREKVRALHSALQNLADEQNGAPLERRREEWQEAMDEACAALAATEEIK